MSSDYVMNFLEASDSEFKVQGINSSQKKKYVFFYCVEVCRSVGMQPLRQDRAACLMFTKYLSCLNYYSGQTVLNVIVACSRYAAKDFSVIFCTHFLMKTKFYSFLRCLSKL